MENDRDVSLADALEETGLVVRPAEDVNDGDDPSAVARLAVLSAVTGGLRRASVALCHQVTTLDRAKLTERLGALPPAVLAAVDGGLKAALDLE